MEQADTGIDAGGAGVGGSVTLSPELWAEVEAVGLRLRACLGEVVRVGVGDAAPSGGAAAANDIASALAIDGVVARKLVKMLSARRGAADVVAQSPKPSQLYIVAERVASRREQLGVSEADAWAFRDAVGKLDKLITAAGGSKMELTRAIRRRRDAAEDAEAGGHYAAAGSAGRDDVVHEGDAAQAPSLRRLLIDSAAERVVDAQSGEVVAHWSSVNPIVDGAGGVVGAVRATREAGLNVIALRSGRFEPVAEDEVGDHGDAGAVGEYADAVDDGSEQASGVASDDGAAMLARSRTWGPAGLEALARVIREVRREERVAFDAVLEPEASGGACGGVVTLAIVPAAGDVVGDAQRFAALVRALGVGDARGLGVIVTPGLAFDAGMREAAADHVGRYVEAAGERVLGIGDVE
jgi:hypothetical protein